MKYSEMTYERLEKEEEKYLEKYDKIEDECVMNGLPFEEFEKKVHKVAEELYFISKYKRLKQDPVVTYGKEWKGDTFTLEEFKSSVRSGIFTDSDGIGYYATETSKSDVEILPSDVNENLIRGDFSHVIWFNK